MLGENVLSLPVIDKETQYREVKRAGKWGTFWGSESLLVIIFYILAFSVHAVASHIRLHPLSPSEAPVLECTRVRTTLCPDRLSFTPSTKTGSKQAPCVPGTVLDPSRICYSITRKWIPFFPLANSAFSTGKIWVFSTGRHKLRMVMICCVNGAGALEGWIGILHPGIAQDFSFHE